MAETHVHYVVNLQGEPQAVQLSLPLWGAVEKYVLAAEKKLTGQDEDPFSKPQPMDAVADLKKFWDFKYPYEAHVHCDACHAATEDWENDPAHPFHLLNANFGGLMVFLCRHCGAHIRKKHFWNKVVFECTPKAEK